MDGDFIIYELSIDSKNRANATNIRYPEDAAAKKRNPRTRLTPYITVAVFAAVVAALLVLGKLPLEILFVYVISGGVTFLAYAFDKAAAMNDRWRTRENTLHLLSLAGGWPAALIAQRMFRHKTHKEEFQSSFWFTVLANCGILFWFTTEHGARFLQAVLKA